MSKSEKIQFDEIRSGDTVKVSFVGQVEQADSSDQSLRFADKGWVFLEGLPPATFKRVAPALIPDDAEFVVWHVGGREVFARKLEDGSWYDEDEDQYDDTKDFEDAIRQVASRNGFEVKVEVLDRRAK